MNTMKPRESVSYGRNRTPRVYSPVNDSSRNRTGSTRFTIMDNGSSFDGSAARRLEHIEKEKSMPRPLKREHQCEWSTFAEYLKINKVASKLMICSVAVAFAMIAVFYIAGSVVVAQAQTSLNAVSDRIEDTQSSISSLSEDYLFSLDTNSASAAAVNAGMACLAINSPIHP